ncbi:MAG: hypothetical protein KDE48_20925 [Anaerolineales bacterium]|nr:hypothetical protein [Anaerolineales bacterium]
MGQLQLLYQLQQTDTEIREKKARLAEVMALQKETAVLKSARLRAENATAELHSWQTALTDLNLELGSINNKAKSSNNRLYSGKVTNPKELTDLQKEIAALGRRSEELEEEVLEAMIMVEEGEAEQETAAAELKTVEAKWQKDQTRLHAEQNELALRLRDLLIARKGQVEPIDPKMMAEYDNMKRRKNGLAVVSIKLGRCQGCHLSVSSHKINQVAQGEMVYCGGCGRLLCPT